MLWKLLSLIGSLMELKNIQQSLESGRSPWVCDVFCSGWGDYPWCSCLLFVLWFVCFLFFFLPGHNLLSGSLSMHVTQDAGSEAADPGEMVHLCRVFGTQGWSLFLTHVPPLSERVKAYILPPIWCRCQYNMQGLGNTNRKIIWTLLYFVFWS